MVAIAPSSDDIGINYFHLGGAGPRLLLAHATGFCGAVWEPFAAALAEHFDCWVLDFRGHGASDTPPPGQFRWQGTADDVLAVIDDIERTHPSQLDGTQPTTSPKWFGIGHSMGGASLILAEATRPGTFACLWIYEPIIFPDLPGLTTAGADGAAGAGSNHLADGAERRRPVFESAQAALENFASKPPMKSFDSAALHGYISGGFVADPDPHAPAGQVRLACEPATEAEVYRNGATHDAWSRLGDIACPVTVAGGSSEIAGPGALSEAIAIQLPRGSYEPHSELGHFGPLEVPELLAGSAIAAFDRVDR